MSGAKPARTGARRAGAAAPSKSARRPGRATEAGGARQPEPSGGKGQSLRHRGVHWQQTPAGVVRWWNADAKRWVPYRPGSDAPPCPPSLEVAGGGPATDKSARASWRSPYRWAPIALMVVVLVVGIIQATGGTNQGAAETAAAQKLLGKCLKQNGVADGHPRYSATAVVCSTPGAAVKVVRVLPGSPGSPSCPVGETAFSLPYPGVRYPHVECLAPVGAGG